MTHVLSSVAVNTRHRLVSCREFTGDAARANRVVSPRRVEALLTLDTVSVLGILVAHFRAWGAVLDRDRLQKSGGVNIAQRVAIKGGGYPKEEGQSSEQRQTCHLSPDKKEKRK